jgi:hypothetical protein
MGIGDEQAEQIIAMHTETVDGLKAQAEQYEADAKKLPGVQKKLDELETAAKDGETDPFKAKYETVKKEFDEYKTGVAAKETAANKQPAYPKLLADCKVNEKHCDAILRVTDFDSVQLDADGNVTGADEIKKKIAEEWADFIVTTEKKPADVENPPAGGGGEPGDLGNLSMQDYIAARQKQTK